MTADPQKDIEYLKAIGRICAETLRKMVSATRAGMSTLELDEIGRVLLEAEGATSAPQAMYHFPGATCISVSPVIAHGIPDGHVLREGELIHIDVSAELDGYFADTGASCMRVRRRSSTSIIPTIAASSTKGWYWRSSRSSPKALDAR